MFEWELRLLDARDLNDLVVSVLKKTDATGLQWVPTAHLDRPVARTSKRRGPPSVGVVEVIQAANGIDAVLDSTFQRWARSPTTAEEGIQGFLLLYADHLESASRQRFEQIVSRWAKSLKWTTWHVWDINDLHDRVTSHPSLLRPHFERLAPANYLERVASVFSPKAAVVARALAISAVADLTSKQWVRTGDAGYRDSSKLKLADIAIDLPCSIDGARKPGVVSELVTRASEFARHGSAVGGEVVVGGPGQGKSTVAQILAHAFRIGLLSGAEGDIVGGKPQEVLAAIAARLTRAKITLPLRRRWPVLIDLVDFGPKAAGVDSLLGYIAGRIDVGGRPLDGPSLLAWISYWPVALILDGLDEIPDRKARSKVIELLSVFIATCNANKVDLHVIATTRPQGYQNEFEDLLNSTRLTLVDLTETEALAYSDELNVLRNGEDPERSTQVTERLVDAVHRRLTQRLMTTPLQVTFMTALAERAVDLPTTRYELFDDYYQTIYDRELAKGKVFAGLSTHRSHVDHLHKRAGLELQKSSESGGSSNALLTRREVTRLLVKRLVDDAGYEDGDAASISDELLQLSSDRLVMLVSPRVGRYGFEVRSLQEYMAARALSEGDDDDVLHAIEVLLPSAHWRNTWLLLVGRVLSTRERLRPRVLSIVQSANTQDQSGLLLTGSLAALDLYLDQIASEFPIDRQALLALALELFADYEVEVPRDLIALATTGLGEDSRSEEIVLSSLDRISRRSNGNLATLYLSTSSGVNALSKQAVATLAEGRKWERGIRREPRDRNYALSARLREMTRRSDEILELANLLSGGVPGAGGNGVTVSAELLAGISPKAANDALLGVAAAQRVPMPDVAQQAIRILRSGIESAPQSKNLTLAMQTSKAD